MKKILSEQNEKTRIRKKLYEKLVDANEIHNTWYVDWIDDYFGSISRVEDLYNILHDAQYYEKSKTEFFMDFACDLYPEAVYCKNYKPKNSSSTQQTTQPQTITKTFSCIQKSTLLKDIPSVVNGEQSVIYTLSSGGRLEFYSGNKFIYVDFENPNNKTNGTWNCDGNTEFIVNTENKKRLSSKVGHWEADISETATPLSITNTKINKRGDEGEEVKEVQNLLKQSGYKDVSKDGSVNGVYDQRTQQMVKDFQSANKDKDGQPLKVDGVAGPTTIEALKRNKLHENIIKLIVDKNLKSISK